MTPYLILITGILSFTLGLLTGDSYGYERGTRDKIAKDVARKYPKDNLQ